MKNVLVTSNDAEIKAEIAARSAAEISARPCYLEQDRKGFARKRTKSFIIQMINQHKIRAYRWRI